jgi:hypothetical protein
MNIYWENVRWETEDTGAVSATLADKEHNSLTLEHRDGEITFRTDGSPKFDTAAILDITAICMVLARTSLSQAAPDTAQAEASNVHVPGPRQAATRHEDVRPRASW